MSTVLKEVSVKEGTYINGLRSAEDFLRTLDWSIGLAAFDKDILVKLDNERVVRISLYGGDGIPRSGEWRAFLAKVIHKSNGEIDRQVFDWDAFEGVKGHRFSYLSMAKEYSWFVPTGGNRHLVNTIMAIDEYIAMWR